MLVYRKNRTIATILAFSGTLTISGLHKFYLGQPFWGIVYGLLSWTLIPKIASAIEGFWYLAQDEAAFDRNFNSAGEAGNAGIRGEIQSLNPQIPNPSPQESIDVNLADVNDWLSLPGISIHQARSLVTLSRSGVKFYCIEDVAAALSVPIHRLQSLNSLLNFSYYDHEPLDQTITFVVNPNTATVASLVKIPGINLSIAETIIQNRLTSGNFRDLVDFQERLEFSGEAIAQLMYYLQF